VTLKLAVSADGMIGKRVGERMVITGMPAYEAVQAMRTTFDTVMVGIGTVMTDDPNLMVRLPGLERLTPTRVVVDSTARIPLTMKLVQTAKDVPLIVIVGPAAPKDRKDTLTAAGVIVLEVPGTSQKVDLAAGLAALLDQGFSRVLSEGGAEIAASLVSGDLLDQVVILRAPVVVGSDGVRALAGTALSAIERSPRYLPVETGLVGADVMRRYVRAT
jgi:diaminohydroxyphosphoribosylaminopyrimidine deaminase/5-amino-6-(5-phosphoribosylamino)uracil reductase